MNLFLRVDLGGTSARNFPTANAYQAGLSGGYDAFVTKLNSDGSTVRFSTYFGGSSDDFSRGVAFDSSGNILLTGYTLSSDFPTADPFQETNGGSYDAFVTKLSSNGSTLRFSTYLGGSGADYSWGVAVDSSQDIVLIGETTSSSDFPTANPFQETNGGSYDAFVTKFTTATEVTRMR